MTTNLLFIANRNSGNGTAPNVQRDLFQALKKSVAEPLRAELALVRDHAEARRIATAFARLHQKDGQEDRVVVVAGGSGTLRASLEGVVEGGALDEDGKRKGKGKGAIFMAPLRMGSGNLVSRRLGFKSDPAAALEQIAASLATRKTRAGCVMRLIHGGPGGSALTRHGVTLAGLGVFGRVPSRVKAINHRFDPLYRAASQRFGIEGANQFSYTAAMATECVRSLFTNPEQSRVEISWKGGQWRGRLFAGAVMNFPVSEMPLRPAVGLEETACELFVLPWRPRLQHLWAFRHATSLFHQAQRMLIRADEPVRIVWDHPGRRTIFLDEDPIQIQGSLSIEVAGTLPFLSADAAA
jgi:diacylglycerol kinase family enzyme